MDYEYGKERRWLVKTSRGLSRPAEEIIGPVLCHPVVPLAEDLTIISHMEWGVRSLACRAQLNPPVAYVIMDQLIWMECQEKDVCSQKLQGLQSHSVYTKGWCNVAYK